MKIWHGTYQFIQGLPSIEDVAKRTRRAAQIVQLMLRLQPACASCLTCRPASGTTCTLWPARTWPWKPPCHSATHATYREADRGALPATAPSCEPTARGSRPSSPKHDSGKPGRARAGNRADRPTMKFLYRQHNKENAKDVTILRQ